MAVSNAALVWLGGVAGMSLALLGLGLGWNVSYVAATTELVSLTAPSERGRLVGFSDLLRELRRGRARPARRPRLQRRRGDRAGARRGRARGHSGRLARGPAATGAATGHRLSFRYNPASADASSASFL